ncbi:O-antigen ligase family protein [Minwuia sp.]|uniref:O-antigen ligase family protein n=1 Tax=Minwuia sp. TaxID=2493630 RepID=UPI003A8E1BB0
MAASDAYGMSGQGGSRVPFFEIALPPFIVFNFLYGAFYNLLPEGLITPIAGVLFAGQTALSLVSILARPSSFRWRLFFLISSLPIIWLVSHLILQHQIDFPQMLRYLGPFYLGLLVFGHYDKFPIRLMAFMACASVIWVMIWSATQPFYLHSNEAVFDEPVPGWWASIVGNGRLAPFHGGPENPHSSGYMALAFMLVIHQCLVWGVLGFRVAVAFIGMAMLYIVGCFSTQVLFAAVAYFGIYGMYWPRIPKVLKVTAGLVGFSLLVLIAAENEERKAAVRNDTNVKLEELGSGRLGTWIERVDIISDRTPAEVWLGTGIGSDNMSSIIWRLKETTSHNTYLTMIIENGVIGFLIYFGVLIMMMLKLGRHGIALFTPVFITALIGNGLSLRPMPFMVFFLAVAVCMWGMARQYHLQKAAADRRRMAARLHDDGW